MSFLGQNMDTFRKDEAEQTTEERKNPQSSIKPPVTIKPPEKSESHKQLLKKRENNYLFKTQYGLLTYHKTELPNFKVCLKRAMLWYTSHFRLTECGVIFTIQKVFAFKYTRSCSHTQMCTHTHTPPHFRKGEKCLSNFSYCLDHLSPLPSLQVSSWTGAISYKSLVIFVHQCHIFRDPNIYASVY